MFHHHLVAAHLRSRFARCERGSVAVSSALALAALLGMSGLAIEYGDALVSRAQTQRVADMAVHAGITAYGSNGDTAAMTLAAQNVADLNGVASDEILVALDADGGAGPVVRVTITTPHPLLLSRMMAGRQSLDVTVRSAATLENGQSACVQALDPAGSGITMSGGTSITTAGCAVASNASVTASGSSKIVTETLSYDSDTAPSFSGGASISAPGGGATSIVRTTTPDPLAEHPALSLAQAGLASVAALQAVQMPTVPTGPDIDFAFDTTATQAQAAAVGCTATFSGSKWTFACPSGGTVTLGNLTIGGGLNLDFALGGLPGTTYSFSGSIRNTGTTMRFGVGTYDIVGGIFTSGGTTTQFGAGTYRIGRASAGCGGSVRYSICNTSTISFAGPSVFELVGGINNGGGATLTLGTGSGNSFRIGPASNGEALTLLGGAITTLGDATGAASVFEVVGNTVSGGYSCLVFGAAARHDIAGSLSLTGGVTFGSGPYFIDGVLHLGAEGGGTSWCQGQNISMRAVGATFVLSGNGASAQNQNCNGGAAFCAGSGYNSMYIEPPSSGPYANFAVIGPLAPNVAAGASFEGGAYGGQISGAFYFPNGPISLAGGASAGGGGGAACLQMIGATVTLSGGTTAASDCIMAASSGVASVRLIE